MRMLWAMYLLPLARKQALEVYKEVHSAKELEKMNEYRERHQGDLPPLKAMMTDAEKKVGHVGKVICINFEHLTKEAKLMSNRTNKRQELSRMREKLKLDLEEAERRVQLEVAEEMRKDAAESPIHR